MTEVLTMPQDGSSHFGPSLRRSSSSSSFILQTATSYPPSASKLMSSYAHIEYGVRLPSSPPSSAPSSPPLYQPDLSEGPSAASTPSSTLSLDEKCGKEEEDIAFPSYEDGDVYTHIGNMEPPPSPETPSTPSTVDVSIAHRDRTAAGDDSAVQQEPTRHVDYLSHNWREEDIWSSWRLIVARRKIYSNSPRLENASWRTWTKSKYRLKTVSPEVLNWLKDHDVTWLYGPLQIGNAKSMSSDSAPTVGLSRSNSFTTKKPILKKRSLSEMMLQRSISSSTLMRQAVDALRAQTTRDRPILGNRMLSDFVSPSDPVVSGSTASTSTPLPSESQSTSGAETPCCKGRHIHFNDKVEQCIAINKDGEDAEEYYQVIQEMSSDEEVLTMKPVPNSKARISNITTPRNSFSNDSKTIAMLPSTTLKYRGDTPEPVEQKMKAGFWNVAAKLSPSPSQETLKASAPSSKYFFDEDDADMSWQPSGSGRRDSVFPRPVQMAGEGDEDEDDDGLERSGLRRTPSGMFMPYDEEEDGFSRTGLFGKVVDTVNTAKDIAHVIWNVGWQR